MGARAGQEPHPDSLLALYRVASIAPADSPERPDQPAPPPAASGTDLDRPPRPEHGERPSWRDWGWSPARTSRFSIRWRRRTLPPSGGACSRRTSQPRPRACLRRSGTSMATKRSGAGYCGCGSPWRQLFRRAGHPVPERPGNHREHPLARLPTQSGPRPRLRRAGAAGEAGTYRSKRSNSSSREIGPRRPSAFMTSDCRPAATEP